MCAGMGLASLPRFRLCAPTWSRLDCSRLSSLGSGSGGRPWQAAACVGARLSRPRPILPVDTRRPLGCDYCKSPNYSSSEAGSFQFSQGPAMPNGSDRPPLKTTSLLAGTTLRRRKNGTRRHTRSSHGPLAARGTSKFSWCRRLLAGPAVRANNSDLRAVRHAELAHDLPNMKFDGTFTHRQLARNDLVRIATAQKFEDRSLSRC